MRSASTKWQAIEGDWGYGFQSEKILVMFGNQKFKEDQCKVRAKFLRQVHGHRVVNSTATSSEQEADAHWTKDKNVGLFIRTADCLPIMMTTEDASVLIAVHAGWRGVQNQIVRTSIEATGVNPKNLTVWIGPHIQVSSFEVEPQICDLLLESIPLDHRNGILNGEFTPYSVRSKNPTRSMVNLKSIVKAQLRDLGVQEIVCTEIDTMTQDSWHSFRRDQANSGRNLSFIARLE